MGNVLLVFPRLFIRTPPQQGMLRQCGTACGGTGKFLGIPQGGRMQQAMQAPDTHTHGKMVQSFSTQIMNPQTEMHYSSVPRDSEGPGTSSLRLDTIPRTGP